MIPIKKVFAVEVSGVCNLEAYCVYCPMHSRPRYRSRGLMTEKTVLRSLDWVKKLGTVDALALHNFGEPLLHPLFDLIALEFARLVPVTMSTNAVLLDKTWADRLEKVPWAWISVSPWKKEDAERGQKLLEERGIKVMNPPGVTHDWAGQAKEGPKRKLFAGCHFLNEGKAVIRWNGDITTCCITDRDEDRLGNIEESSPDEITLKGYSLCETCHHAV